MADLAARLASASQVAAADRRVRVTDLERRLGTRFTADTLHLMRKYSPLTKFVWLMGADNLGQVSAWDRWTSIFTTVPIAVFARKPYDIKALSGLAAHRFRGARIPESQARALVCAIPPAWVFIPCPHHPASATAIRQATSSLTGMLQSQDHIYQLD